VGEGVGEGADLIHEQVCGELGVGVGVGVGVGGGGGGGLDWVGRDWKGEGMGSRGVVCSWDG